MKDFNKPLKSPTLCKLAQDHADRLVNQYGGCLRKTDPSKRPNQGESLAMNMEESLKGIVQFIFAETNISQMTVTHVIERLKRCNFECH